MIQAFTETYSPAPSQGKFSDILSRGKDAGASFSEYLHTLRTAAGEKDKSVEEPGSEDVRKAAVSPQSGADETAKKTAETEANKAAKKSDAADGVEARKTREENEALKKNEDESKSGEVNRRKIRLNKNGDSEKSDKSAAEVAGKSKSEKQTENLVEGLAEQKPGKAEKARREGLSVEGDRLHSKSGREAEVSTATTDALKGKKDISKKEERQELGEKAKSSSFFKDAKSEKEAKSGKEKLSLVDTRTEKGKGERDSIGGRREALPPDTDGSKAHRETESRALFKEGQIKDAGDSVKLGSGDKELATDKVQVLRVDTASLGDRTENVGTARIQTKGEGGFLKQLQERLNPEIVKRAGIIVRDGGRGEIRLDIKPEHLGNVRIRVSLEDSNIVGKIFVENSSIRNIFEQNLQNLQRSFREHGFETASLEVTVGDGRQHRREDRKEHAASVAGRGAIRTLEDHVPDALRGFEEEQLVDLVV